MKCAICGNDIINENISRDHVFPRALYKWQELTLDSDDYNRLKSAIESSSNIVKTHYKCNISKEDSLYDINTLFLSEKQFARLSRKSQLIFPYIEGYLNIKKDILSQQNDCCYICKKKLVESRVLRRIDKNLPRNRENACVICHECNRLVDTNPLQ